MIYDAIKHVCCCSLLLNLLSGNKWRSVLHFSCHLSLSPSPDGDSMCKLLSHLTLCRLFSAKSNYCRAQKPQQKSMKSSSERTEHGVCEERITSRRGEKRQQKLWLIVKVLIHFCRRCSLFTATMADESFFSFHVFCVCKRDDGVPRCFVFSFVVP